MNRLFDVVIVGGGPAGLSAALVLGRARRRVIVVDEGNPRNRISSAVHGFLSRDGIAPGELLRLSREQLRPYPNVTMLEDRVESATRTGQTFHLQTRSGQSLAGRKVILATGVIDDLPPVAGLRDCYGKSAFHCPYCDGWECRDQPLAIYGHDDQHGAALALELLIWSRDVVLCLDGRDEISKEYRERLNKYGVTIRPEPIERLEARSGRLERIVFRDGASLERRALFFHSLGRRPNQLAGQLGCALQDDKRDDIGKQGQTTVPGLYVIGDASRDVLQVAVAVGEGSAAAIAVNTELLKEDFV